MIKFLSQHGLKYGNYVLPEKPGVKNESKCFFPIFYEQNLLKFLKYEEYFKSFLVKAQNLNKSTGFML